MTRHVLKTLLLYCGIVAASVMAALLIAEFYLSSRATPKLAIPFYNRLYPYVMFRPYENDAYISATTFAMSHHASRVYHYTNADGFRVTSKDYPLPRQKPAGQLRIAVLGGSAVQLGSTFETTLPGSLKTLLQKQYPGRDIEVINAGIQSCVSRQSIAQLLFTVTEYQPDVVILYDGVNDIGLPMTYESRPNFPYNFQAMEEAWDSYRRSYQEPLFRLLLHRSYVYGLIRGRRNRTASPGNPFIGPNAVRAERVIRDRDFVQNHIAEYLSNWRKLIELSAAYHYQTVCILQPTGGLDREYAEPLIRKEYQLDREAASSWLEAFSVLYREADRQIEDLRRVYPRAVLLNLSASLKPSQKYFWDLAHVYDETNMLLAERIHRDTQHTIPLAR